jgi:hypothetical protein
MSAQEILIEEIKRQPEPVVREVWQVDMGMAAKTRPAVVLIAASIRKLP